MTKIKRIVTSQVESRVTSDNNEPSAYSYTSDGTITFHDENSQGRPFIGPGVFYGAGEDSADQSGLNTIKLIPNDGLGTDQYIVIEPTNPNHIHIRAGGTQDESNADLILGGERNNVYIEDDARIVSISTRPPRVENTYQNLNEVSSSEFITNVLSEITFDYNVVVDGVTYTVTNVDVSGQPAGLMAITAAGATFQPGVYYTFTFEQSWNNYWQFGSDGTLSGPSMGGLKVLGLLNSGDNDLGLYANDADIILQTADGAVNIVAPEVNIVSNVVPSSFNINTYLGATVNSNRTSTYAPEDKVVATLGDINLSLGAGVNGEVTRWSPNFQATGLAFTGTENTYPTYNSYYVKNGRMVSFNIEVDLSTVTNFGTGQYKLQLPFTPQFGFNHFSGWAWADPDVSPDTGTGHTIINADTAGVTDVLDLHYLKSAGGANTPIREGLFVQGTPVTLTTISKIYVNGTYITSA